jgi:hypothetical protein
MDIVGSYIEDMTPEQFASYCRLHDLDPDKPQHLLAREVLERGKELVLIPSQDYKELRAANDLLCRVFDDQGDLIDTYWEEYEDMMIAAGFEREEEE